MCREHGCPFHDATPGTNPTADSLAVLLLSLALLRPDKASSAQDAQRNAKQMEPMFVNGSVHTAHKQHQRVCVRICVRVLCGLGLNRTATNFSFTRNFALSGVLTLCRATPGPRSGSGVRSCHSSWPRGYRTTLTAEP